MSDSSGHFPFLRLPRELRDVIYEDTLLPEIDLRNGYHCPNILIISRQIHMEASQRLYARAPTITVTDRFVTFLNRYFPVSADGGIADSIVAVFPPSFPYHKYKALRIHIIIPKMPSRFISVGDTLEIIPFESRPSWILFERNVKNLGIALGTIADRDLPLRKLVLDVSAPCDRRGSVTLKGVNRVHVNLSRLLGFLDLERWIAETCEIRLGKWAQEFPQTVQAARHWGYLATSLGRSLEQGRKDDDCVISFEEVKNYLRTASPRQLAGGKRHGCSGRL